MDETQKRKLNAKEFIQKNSKIGFIVLTIFISLFIIYFASVYFYSKKEIAKTDNATTTADDTPFNFSLLPVFNQGEQTKELNIGSDILGSFTNNNNLNTNGENSPANDNSKIIKIENTPTLGYVIFDKPISIKNYIKNKPKVCDVKVEPVLAKEAKGIAVRNFQNMLRTVDEYSDVPDTGILDNATREKIYIFQKRYSDILYKNKADKEPTRLIDKETTHFLNLLCNFETENASDFVQVPTLRYVTALNREIFDYNTESKEKVKVAGVTATGTREVIFSAKGEYAVFRKDDLGKLISEFYNVRTKSVTRLQLDISTLDFNSKNLLVFGVPGDRGMTIKTYDQNKNTVKTVAQIPLNEWNLFWISDTEIGISSKPTAYAEGIYMSLNTTTNKLKQLAGPLLGLSVQKTSLPDFSIMSTGGLGDTKTLLINNKTRNIGDLGIKTFAEKCSQTIFANGIFCAVPKNLDPNVIYPDDWYKQKILTQDILVYKSISGTTTRAISYLENRPISIINLQINKNGIFFIDEATMNLYSLEL